MDTPRRSAIASGGTSSATGGALRYGQLLPHRRPLRAASIAESDLSGNQRGHLERATDQDPTGRRMILASFAAAVVLRVWREPRGSPRGTPERDRERFLGVDAVSRREPRDAADRLRVEKHEDPGDRSVGGPERDRVTRIREGHRHLRPCKYKVAPSSHGPSAASSDGKATAEAVLLVLPPSSQLRQSHGAAAVVGGLWGAPSRDIQSPSFSLSSRSEYSPGASRPSAMAITALQ
jgi:hypothetical protein